MKTWRLKRSAEDIAEARQKDLSEEIIEKLSELADMLPDEPNWLVIKVNLMRELPPGDRQLFSSRDPFTKKHYPFNVFENALRKKWLELTGNTLLMPDEKKLDCDDVEGYL